ncbi:uncharacterized protein LOC134247804 [Saccostrea cucullata]|uniref:uncharacterized protein LOC134247804 n=1 Tax=Saccostrea cuccullata TaxID=36930 RepID=UPI002ED5D978
MAGIVDSCPRNLTETLIASARLGCGQDKYGNKQYLCLPNSEKTGLVEFCHDGVMWLLERGYCLETTGDQLSKTNCSHFLMGCPDTEVHINEMYRYPACLRISTEYQCYLADPICGNTTWDTTTKDKTEELVTHGFSTDHGIYNITETIIQTTTLADNNSALIGAIVGILVVVLVAILLPLTVFLVLRRRKLRQEKGKAEVIEDENQVLLEPLPTMDIRQEDENQVLLEPLPTMDIRQGSRVNDTQEPGDIVGTAEDDENDNFGVPESERSLLATDEGTIEIQRAVVNGDPADSEEFVIQADDGDNIMKQNSLTQSRRKRSKNTDTTHFIISFFIVIF